MKSTLDITHPHLIAEWHPTKNGELKPSDFTHGSNSLCWWICPDCHSDYDAIIKSRSRGHGCRFCYGQEANETNCLAIKNPVLAAEWHPTKNGNITPRNITPGNNKLKVWWLCPDCNSSYDLITNLRSRGQNCPYCRGLRVNETNSLATQNPTLAAEWHPTKNGKLTSHDFTCGSNYKVWWLCPKCISTYDATINDRSNGRACPFCAGRKVNKTNCLVTTHPGLADEWHPTLNGNKTPYDFTFGAQCRTKVWWLCPNCHSSYDMSVAARGSTEWGCPFCAGKRVNETNCLATTHPELAKEWHPLLNKNSTPFTVSHGSDRKFWWLCIDCYTPYNAAISNRSISDSGCPSCSKSKNEKLTGKILDELFPTQMISSQFKVKVFPLQPFSITGTIRIDYRLKLFDQEYFIEYNGRQHYEPVIFGTTMTYEEANVAFAKQQAKDQWIEHYCNISGIILISIDGRKYKGTKIRPYLEQAFCK